MIFLQIYDFFFNRATYKLKKGDVLHFLIIMRQKILLSSFLFVPLHKKGIASLN